MKKNIALHALTATVSALITTLIWSHALGINMLGIVWTIAACAVGGCSYSFIN